MGICPVAWSALDTNWFAPFPKNHKTYLPSQTNPTSPPMGGGRKFQFVFNHSQRLSDALEDPF